MNINDFNSYVLDGLIPILQDEFKFLKDNRACVECKLLDAYNNNANKNGNIDYYENTSAKMEDDLLNELGELYFLYDSHKLKCKCSTGQKSIRIDRHKVAAIMLCLIIDYTPIKFLKNIDKLKLDEEIKVQVRVVNYRIAFRFALYYARVSLYASFANKTNETNKFAFKNNGQDEYGNTKEDFDCAIKLFENHEYPYFPMTRDGLDSYKDNYVILLYLYFNELPTDVVRPYLFIADTFYLLDVYAKKELGLKVPSVDYGDKGLAHYLPEEISANNDEADEKDE